MSVGARAHQIAQKIGGAACQVEAQAAEFVPGTRRAVDQRGAQRCRGKKLCAVRQFPAQRQHLNKACHVAKIAEYTRVARKTAQKPGVFIMDGTAQQLARGRVPFRGSDIPRRAVGSVRQAQRLEYILLCQPVDGLAADLFQNTPQKDVSHAAVNGQSARRMLQRVGKDRPDGVSGAVRFLAEIKMGGQAAGMCHQLEHSNAFFVFGRGEKLFHCIVKAQPPFLQKAECDHRGAHDL